MRSGATCFSVVRYVSGAPTKHLTVHLMTFILLLQLGVCANDR